MPLGLGRVVTLTEVKGLSERFFASRRMTQLEAFVVRCTKSQLSLNSVSTFLLALALVLSDWL